MTYNVFGGTVDVKPCSIYLSADTSLTLRYVRVENRH